MTDGRDLPRKDEGRLGRDLGALDAGVKKAQSPSGWEIGESLFGGLIGRVRLRSARTNFSCSLKLRRAREDGAKVLRSGPEGVEKGGSRALARSGVGRLVSFGALGDPRISFHLTIPYVYARTDVSLGSISYCA
jgi:hypothetical protein